MKKPRIYPPPTALVRALGLEPAARPVVSVELPGVLAAASRLLTAEAYHRLAHVPPEIEWFSNLRQ